MEQPKILTYLTQETKTVQETWKQNQKDKIFGVGILSFCSCESDYLSSDEWKTNFIL